jgi:hypothetical protein
MSLDQTITVDTSQASDDLEPDDSPGVFGDTVWVSTLDASTCLECADLDGTINPDDTAPLHYNCRCLVSPVIDGGLNGSRPSVPVTEDMLDGLSPDERTAAVRELVGQVPASTSYSEWFSEQSEEFQRDVLGSARFEMYQSGEFTLSDFVDFDGSTLTLAELNAELEIRDVVGDIAATAGDLTVDMLAKLSDEAVLAFTPDMIAEMAPAVGHAVAVRLASINATGR